GHRLASSSASLCLWSFKKQPVVARRRATRNSYELPALVPESINGGLLKSENHAQREGFGQRTCFDQGVPNLRVSRRNAVFSRFNKPPISAGSPSFRVLSDDLGILPA